MTTTLPPVTFITENGPVERTAAESVFATKVAPLTYEIRLAHPEGGYLPLTRVGSQEGADAQVALLSEAVAAWARLSEV